MCGSVGAGGVEGGTLLAGGLGRLGVPRPLIESRDVTRGAGGDRLTGDAALQAAGTAAEFGGQQLRCPADADERLQPAAVQSGQRQRSLT
jgi:hypothetical protein